MLGSTLEHVNRFFLLLFIYFSSFPSLVVTVILFYQFIYFHIFSFPYWLPFFLFCNSASAARGSAIHVFLVFGYLCIQEILVVTKS